VEEQLVLGYVDLDFVREDDAVRAFLECCLELFAATTSVLECPHFVAHW
jgi:hypothetical protein